MRMMIEIGCIENKEKKLETGFKLLSLSLYQTGYIKLIYIPIGFALLFFHW